MASFEQLATACNPPCVVATAYHRATALRSHAASLPVHATHASTCHSQAPSRTSGRGCGCGCAAAPAPRGGGHGSASESGPCRRAAAHPPPPPPPAPCGRGLDSGWLGTKCTHRVQLAAAQHTGQRMQRSTRLPCSTSHPTLTRARPAAGTRPRLAPASAAARCASAGWPASLRRRSA